jgi:hypothetical protein
VRNEYHQFLALKVLPMPQAMEPSISIGDTVSGNGIQKVLVMILTTLTKIMLV